MKEASVQSDRHRKRERERERGGMVGLPRLMPTAVARFMSIARTVFLASLVLFKLIFFLTAIAKVCSKVVVISRVFRKSFRLFFFWVGF